MCYAPQLWCQRICGMPARARAEQGQATLAAEPAWPWAARETHRSRQVLCQEQPVAARAEQRRPARPVARLFPVALRDRVELGLAELAWPWPVATPFWSQILAGQEQGLAAAARAQGQA